MKDTQFYPYSNLDVAPQGSARVDVPPANLRLTRHREAAATRGEEIQERRHRLARADV